MLEPEARKYLDLFTKDLTEWVEFCRIPAAIFPWGIIPVFFCTVYWASWKSEIGSCRGGNCRQDLMWFEDLD
jgi:hypothetical protein